MEQNIRCRTKPHVGTSKPVDASITTYPPSS
jgi:hypothetical protein